MSETPALWAIYVDGETKTGKGAAGKAIAEALQSIGLTVYYDVAGDFFRRYTVLVRQHLGLAESEILPTGADLEAAAAAIHETRQAYRTDFDYGDLQRPIISQSVAILGELPLVQKAVEEWWTMTLRLAQNHDVLVVDARNPRSRVRQVSASTDVVVSTALDLFMTCDPVEAARRVLRVDGVPTPSDEQLEVARQKVELRRKRDRERADKPFIVPVFTLTFDPRKMNAATVLAETWQGHEGIELPVTVKLDNTHLTQPEMLAAVSELAVEAIKLAKK